MLQSPKLQSSIMNKTTVAISSSLAHQLQVSREPSYDAQTKLL